jgi:hypothetical protein
MSGSGCDGSSGSGSSGCSRVLTKEQMIKGLKAGKLLYVDRRDAPELPELLALEAEGLVKKRLVEFDEQSSALEFWWIGSVA